MPLYEYKCSKCQAKFEVIQKVTDPPLKKCVKCGGPVIKTITAPAIQFKGSGWYITDYAKKTDEKEQKAPDKAKKETQKTEAPSSPKTEKQPSPTAKQS